MVYRVPFDVVCHAASASVSYTHLDVYKRQEMQLQSSVQSVKHQLPNSQNRKKE